MDQNSAHPSFNMDYTPMRKPHSNHGGGTGHSPSVLSPNAPEFIPRQSKQQPNNIAPIQDSFSNLNLNSATRVIQPHQLHVQQQFRLNFQQQQPQNCVPQNQPHFNHYQQNCIKPVQQSLSSVQDRLKNHHPSSYQHKLHQGHQQNMSSPMQNKPSSSTSLQNRFKLPSNTHQNSVEHHQQKQHHHQNHQYYQHQMQQQQHHQHHQQSQESSSSLSSVINNSETSQGALQEQAEGEAFALNYITEIVDCLSSDPGSFDSIAPRALAVFHGFGENQYVLSNAMEIIFSQSIEEQNFRYMGAKLYGLLDSINPKKDSVFRNLLNFKLDYHRNEIIKYMQNENLKVRGTTLFLAELYMQLRNNGSRMSEIAQNIIFTMKQLLQKHTPENIKCICLTLKLAGYDLELDCPNDLINIIENLRQLNMDISTSRLLEATLSLHKNNWGRNETINNQVNYHYTPNTAIRCSNEPVFYGPDGQILTEEENSFLEANIPSEIANDDDSDLDDFDFDQGGMDPEMEKDYNEFLKNTVNHSC